ncbi:MAG: sigma-54 dependent transcriptional regulator [Dehalococcoidales bacterium]|jgi:DNA-binding NtrC family response regulator|nr:sigma-54 dependent transcriptional regulator [Dehalococcoidales bacterium]
MKRKTKILIVDDEAIMRDSLRDWLSDVGHDVLTAENSTQALEIIQKENPAVAVIDLVLPGADGLELLRKAKQLAPDIQVIIITAYGSIATAITAIKEGAYDYIEKPFPPEKIELLIDKLVERQSLLDENLSLRHKLEEKYSFENIVAKSAQMQKIIEMVKVVARSNATVMISGESGTGKELIARAIHSQSYRKSKPFVAISCASLPENLLEAELFGVEKGAFAGNLTQRKGKLEAASKGTLFLDDVCDLCANIQGHLLRVLEEKEFTRVGGSEPVRADARIISATSKDIRKAVEAKQFREDLYYRLNVVTIELPPLRERREDIPVLAEHFLRRFCQENQKKITGFSAEANDFLLKYEWPGNIRELENAVERAVILARGNLIEVEDLSPQSSYAAQKAPVGKTMREVEKNHILNILIEAGGNCSEAARLLGISRMTLYNKIKTYGLNLNKLEHGDS